jgi:hypothetical protein
MKLSLKQEEALQKVKEAGELYHVTGGSWIQASVSFETFLNASDRPWHAPTQTIQALVRRGLLAWSDTSKGYPTRVCLPSSLPKGFSCCGGTDEHPPEHTQDCHHFHVD